MNKINHKYTVRLYTWTALGGVLAEWQVKIEKGKITHVWAKVIDTFVGHHPSPPLEGFIPSPGAILINY
jgi:hypothetical protein